MGWWGGRLPEEGFNWSKGQRESFECRRASQNAFVTSNLYKAGVIPDVPSSLLPLQALFNMNKVLARPKPITPPVLEHSHPYPTVFFIAISRDPFSQALFNVNKVLARPKPITPPVLEDSHPCRTVVFIAMCAAAPPGLLHCLCSPDAWPRKATLDMQRSAAWGVPSLCHLPHAKWPFEHVCFPPALMKCAVPPPPPSITLRVQPFSPRRDADTPNPHGLKGKAMSAHVSPSLGRFEQSK